MRLDLGNAHKKKRPYLRQTRRRQPLFRKRLGFGFLLHHLEPLHLDFYFLAVLQQHGLVLHVIRSGPLLDLVAESLQLFDLLFQIGLIRSDGIAIGLVRWGQGLGQG